MKKLFFICLFLFTFTCGNLSAQNINPEYKNEQILLCLPLGADNSINSNDSNVCRCSYDMFSKRTFEQALDFAKKIKYVYRTQDIETFSNIISYPIYINGYKGKKKTIIINSKKELLKLDKNILLNQNIFLEIDQNRLFWNWRGFMLGNGSIWFWSDDKISDISINL